jgi:hypothetical protein
LNNHPAGFSRVVLRNLRSLQHRGASASLNDDQGYDRIQLACLDCPLMTLEPVFLLAA